MTDSELIEAAARAAGLTGYIHEWVGGPYFIVPADPEKADSRPVTYDWLNDDGDALRLAVKLRLSIVHENEFIQGEHIPTIEVMGQEREDGSRHCEMHSLDDDPEAATRRAIVRAAAALHDGGNPR